MKTSATTQIYRLTALLCFSMILSSSTCDKKDTVVEANGKVVAPKNGPSNNSGWTTPQIWDLTLEGNQVATVSVAPFTNSGTFNETSSSAGWWLPLPCAPGGQVRIPVSGSITVTSTGAHWTFTGMSFSGCGTWSFLGSGGGYANSNMPAATSIIGGTLHLDENGPLGNNYQDGTWTAKRRN